MTLFGKVSFNGKTIHLQGQPELTGRVLPQQYVQHNEVEYGELYDCEFATHGHDEDGEPVIVKWIHPLFKGNEQDFEDLDWDDVQSVEPDPNRDLPVYDFEVHIKGQPNEDIKVKGVSQLQALRIAQAKHSGREGYRAIISTDPHKI